MNIYEESLEYHKNLKGKLEVKLKEDLKNRKDLSLAYTPGVAEPCRKIAEDKAKVYDYTWKQNSVAVVTISGMSLAAIAGILLNLLLPEEQYLVL